VGGCKHASRNNHIVIDTAASLQWPLPPHELWNLQARWCWAPSKMDNLLSSQGMTPRPHIYFIKYSNWIDLQVIFSSLFIVRLMVFLTWSLEFHCVAVICCAGWHYFAFCSVGGLPASFSVLWWHNNLRTCFPIGILNNTVTIMISIMWWLIEITHKGWDDSWNIRRRLQLQRTKWKSTTLLRPTMISRSWLFIIIRTIQMIQSILNLLDFRNLHSQTL